MHLADADTADVVTVHTDGAGLIIGVNNHGQPVAIRLFRPELTSALAVGGLRFAQLITFRALAVGAQVVVQTGRPTAWSPFARMCAASAEALWINPDVEEDGPGTVNHPQLRVVDSESPAAVEGETQAAHQWSTVLTVREHLSGWDTPALARMDLALMQRLSPAEAHVVAATVNVPDFERQVAALTGRMVALITPATLHWARVAQTDIENRVIGPIDPAYG